MRNANLHLAISKKLVALCSESHSLVAVKVHPAVKFNLELKFILEGSG